MSARIYKPAKTAMQSGPAAEYWVLEYTPSEQKQIDPLMGWTGSGDTQTQVRMKFESKEAALAYAKKHGVAAVIQEPRARKVNVRPMGYAQNFSSARKVPWSH